MSYHESQKMVTCKSLSKDQAEADIHRIYGGYSGFDFYKTEYDRSEMIYIAYAFINILP